LRRLPLADNGFGDSQPIAIGIDNNWIVGPDRAGPRNMRRAPMVLNTAFFPALMWNGRFSSVSGDPFDNSAGFSFPVPEGAGLSYEPHLLVAQAFIPPTERTEVAGFAFPGDNDAIRTEVARRVNAVPGYRRRFGEVFPGVRDGAPVDFEMFARAIAEFEFALTFADAPIDRYARAANGALDSAEKRGALLFFGTAGCAQCHAVSGSSDETFTDFREHAIAVPQVVPSSTNNAFDGSDANQDFGREDATGDPPTGIASARRRWSSRELAAPAVLQRWRVLPSVTPGWSGGVGVERAQGVEGALGDLAGGVTRTQFSTGAEGSTFDRPCSGCGGTAAWLSMSSSS
jgi:cytochrome c peroxidase